ncbi:galactose mutarotase-like enzyme [Aequitasia blattaphilus]|uniref:Aldose 1-epimerase family protein n=1 Tax=Aequitasia blattaphilus TaxID=2949332 RepID=A0ABT1ECP4_9FIRM|nr:aldose 1-epimerase family protein [Aequitasia blattaphilus]MCP1103436.1 aldose 1-epimerase family protein [Aequitasia blattaphilus]MCR8616076.1 aldose 1-epimerase family protein [Aequitasia blattaphilus]
MKNEYIGHESQMVRVEEHRLIGGRGDGLRLLEIENGKGLHLTLNLDKCGDISRLSCKGVNLGYFSPCGYVHPSYYDSRGTEFLKSFTAGFLTTCGLQNVGCACVDEGIEYGLHGSISNTPSHYHAYKCMDDKIEIQAVMEDAVLFGTKLRLNRTYVVSLVDNTFTLTDEVENRGTTDVPIQLLYHLNMGYPLLDEDSIVEVSSESVEPRDERAREGYENWMKMEKPQVDFTEQCYFHTCKEKGEASIFQPKLDTKVRIAFDLSTLDSFTEWKMMGVNDYVLGLECGNCYPIGREASRAEGSLKYIKAGEKIRYQVEFAITHPNMNNG